MICPACGYETFHPRATTCDLCAAPLNPSAPTAEPQARGELEAMASAVAAADEAELEEAVTASAARRQKVAERVARAPGVPAGPPSSGVNALLFVLALPLGLVPAAWGLGLESQREVPTSAWMASGVLTMLGAIAVAVVWGPAHPLLTAIPTLLAVCGVAGGVLLGRLARGAPGATAVALSLLAATTPLFFLVSSIGEEKVFAGHRGLINAMQLSPDGKTLVTGAEDRLAIVWDVASGRPRARLEGNKKGVSAVGLVGGTNKVVTGSWDGTLRLFDGDSGTQQSSRDLVPAGIPALVVRPQGDLVIYGTPAGAVMLAPVAGGEATELGSHDTAITALAVTDDGTLAASASADGLVQLWNLNSRTLSAQLVGHERTVRALAFVDDRRLVTGGYDNTLRVWEDGEQRLEVDLASPVRSVDVDGSRAVTVGSDRMLILWDIDLGEKQSFYKLRNGQAPAAVVFSPDGRNVLVTDDDQVREIPLDRFQR